MEIINKFLCVVFSLLCISLGSLAQTGVIEGKVIQKKDSVAYVGVYIALYKNNNIVDETISDIDGNFKFSTIPIGSYDIKFNYVYKKRMKLKDLSVESDHVLKLAVVYPR